jgi:hypothetical protein
MKSQYEKMVDSLIAQGKSVEEARIQLATNEWQPSSRIERTNKPPSLVKGNREPQFKRNELFNIIIKGSVPSIEQGMTRYAEETTHP